MLSATINGVKVEVPENTTILHACQNLGIYVPTLCGHSDLPPAGACGICVVKVNGKDFALSCATKVTDGMVIETNTKEVKERAFTALNEFSDMPLLPRSREIEEIYEYLVPKKPIRMRKAEKTHALDFNPDQCVNCGRCVRQCGDIQMIAALDTGDHSLKENECISCGQCTTVCPTNALIENKSIPRVMRALAAGKILCLQTAPAVRVSVGENFNDPVGTVVTGKIIAAARQMGFKYIFDTNFGADVTIMEEGTELIGRIQNNGVLPMFTSCCPAWINFVEKLHPELIPNLSSTKSPHMLEGAIIKTFFAQKQNIDPSQLFVVSLMPCTAKKDEIERKQMPGNVDAVITAREFGEMVEQFGIDWNTLEDGEFDRLLGESTGAAALFGVTGGVMEAALRYAHEQLTLSKLGNVEYTQVRGFKRIKKATVIIGDLPVNVAVCSGIAEARQFIESGAYKGCQFIEVMACPTGCIGGGGQPKLLHRSQAKARANAIYELDHQSKNKRTCNDNSEAVTLYSEFFEHPGSHLAHELLHTHYEPQITSVLEMKRKMESLPLVCYGSASGTAIKLGRQIADIIGTAPVSLNACGVNKMQKKGVAVILISTFGDGEYPSNAIKFIEQLKTEKPDLKDLKYSIVALGSKDYPKYCFAGHELDKMLTGFGAQKLTPLVEVDSSSADKGESVFEQWLFSAANALGLPTPKIEVKSQYLLTVSDKPEDKHIPPHTFEYGVMNSSTVLTPPDYQPAMHRYQVKLPVNMTYEAGDHVAILPTNDPGVVSAVLKVLNLDPSVVYNVETDIPEGDQFIPELASVRQLFTQYLDLNGQPTRALVRAFLQYTTDPLTKERLQEYVDPKNERVWLEYIKDCNVSEFLHEYSPFGVPPLDVLVTAIPPIKPRVYSIASDSSASSRFIDLIITDVIFGDNRTGLCTSHLARFGLTRIAVRTQKGCFAYPKDNTAPIIMAALGCGVAPMLSLLQHRESLQGPIGDAALFFGCRHKNTYPILDSNLQNYVDLDLLQDLFIAYSREGTTKTYITDLMTMNPEKVWEYWKNPKTEFFYCGPARGIPDTLKSIILRVTMEYGKMTREEAEDFYNLHPNHIEAF